MLGVHQVVLRGVPVHQVDAAAAARPNVASHAALVHDLQGLGEVGVVDEVQAAQLLVGESSGGAHGGQQLGAHGLHGALLHRSSKCRQRGRGLLWPAAWGGGGASRAALLKTLGCVGGSPLVLAGMWSPKADVCR